MISQIQLSLYRLVIFMASVVFLVPSFVMWLQFVLPWNNDLTDFMSTNVCMDKLAVTGAEDIYTGVCIILWFLVKPRTTVIHKPRISCDWITGYFSCCSWRVHHTVKIGGVYKFCEYKKERKLASTLELCDHKINICLRW